jgi:hypothetical protein
MVILGPSFNDFRPLKILLPTGISKRENVGNLLGLHMKDMGMSLKDTSKEETPQNLTLKFVEEMVEDVLESNKIIEMFKVMVIICMKMGNLGLEVQSITIVEGEKQGLLK